jgi:hypothetical protein
MIDKKYSNCSSLLLSIFNNTPLKNCVLVLSAGRNYWYGFGDKIVRINASLKCLVSKSINLF